MQAAGGGKVSCKANGNYHKLDQSQTVSFTNAPSSINRWRSSSWEAGEHLLMLNVTNTFHGETDIAIK